MAVGVMPQQIFFFTNISSIFPLTNSGKFYDFYTYTQVYTDVLQYKSYCPDEWNSETENAKNAYS